MNRLQQIIVEIGFPGWCLTAKTKGDFAWFSFLVGLSL
jgi:hypothetical protein